MCQDVTVECSIYKLDGLKQKWDLKRLKRTKRTFYKMSDICVLYCVPNIGIYRTYGQSLDLFVLRRGTSTLTFPHCNVDRWTLLRQSLFKFYFAIVFWNNCHIQIYYGTVFCLYCYPKQHKKVNVSRCYSKVFNIQIRCIKTELRFKTIRCHVY